jgi:hypothetical protein
MEPLRSADNNSLPTTASPAAHGIHIDTSVVSPVGGTISPPYWQGENASPVLQSGGRGNAPRLRAESDSSLRSPQIQLEDHSNEDSEQYRACWAKSARIDDWVIVGSSSGITSIGSYVVFNCLIETSNVSSYNTS